MTNAQMNQTLELNDNQLDGIAGGGRLRRQMKNDPDLKEKIEEGTKEILRKMNG